MLELPGAAFDPEEGIAPEVGAPKDGAAPGEAAASEGWVAEGFANCFFFSSIRPETSGLERGPRRNENAQRV